MLFGHTRAIDMTHESTLTLGHANPVDSAYFKATADVVASLLLGRRIETRSKREVGLAIRALLEAGAKEAAILRDGAEVATLAGKLSLNDLTMMRPGEKVAADGVVVESSSTVDAIVITDRSLPVEIDPDSAVVSGSINTTKRLMVRAAVVGSTIQVVQIVRLIEEAQTGRTQARRLTNRITEFFMPTILVLSILTFMMQLLADADPTFALVAGMAILIVACSYALGLATPPTLLVGTGRDAGLDAIVRGV